MFTTTRKSTQRLAAGADLHVGAVIRSKSHTEGAAPDQRVTSQMSEDWNDNEPSVAEFDSLGEQTRSIQDNKQSQYNTTSYQNTYDIVMPCKDSFARTEQHLLSSRSSSVILGYAETKRFRRCEEVTTALGPLDRRSSGRYACVASNGSGPSEYLQGKHHRVLGSLATPSVRASCVGLNNGGSLQNNRGVDQDKVTKSTALRMPITCDHEGCRSTIDSNNFRFIGSICHSLPSAQSSVESTSTLANTYEPSSSTSGRRRLFDADYARLPRPLTFPRLSIYDVSSNDSSDEAQFPATDHRTVSNAFLHQISASRSTDTALLSGNIERQQGFLSSVDEAYKLGRVVGEVTLVRAASELHDYPVSLVRPMLQLGHRFAARSTSQSVGPQSKSPRTKRKYGQVFAIHEDTQDCCTIVSSRVGNPTQHIHSLDYPKENSEDYIDNGSVELQGMHSLPVYGGTSQ